MSTLLPTVTARGALASTRALFLLASASLTPLLAQHLFNADAPVRVVALFALAGMTGSLAVSRLAVRSDLRRPALRVFATALGLGLPLGIAAAFAAAHETETTLSGDRMVLATLFGGIYGVGVGAAFGAAFALWTRRVRLALGEPSALGSQRLTMEGGLALSLAGAVGMANYRIPALSLASALLGFAGVVVTLAAIVRVMRLQSLFASMGTPNSGYVVVPRTQGTEAPAFAWAPPLDRMIVRTVDPAAVDASAPFRGRSQDEPIAVVPADLSHVRRAIGAAVAFGFVAIVASGALQVGAFLLSCTTSSSCCH